MSRRTESKSEIRRSILQGAKKRLLSRQPATGFILRNSIVVMSAPEANPRLAAQPSTRYTSTFIAGRGPQIVHCSLDVVYLVLRLGLLRAGFAELLLEDNRRVWQRQPVIGAPCGCHGCPGRWIARLQQACIRDKSSRTRLLHLAIDADLKNPQRERLRDAQC